MFYISTKKEPYFYRAQRVKRGTTKNGDAYTFIDIACKDKKDGDKYKNASLSIWADVDIAEGDKIAILSVSGVNYSESESGFKKYIRLDITVTRYEVEKATTEEREEREKKKSEKTSINGGKAADKKPPKQPQIPQNNTVDESSNKSKVPTDDTLYGGSDNWDIPF